jgi:hypothetical protein
MPYEQCRHVVLPAFLNFSSDVPAVWIRDFVK